MREVARKIPGTPTLYLHYRSPTLEKPSIESTSLAEHQTKYKSLKNLLSFRLTVNLNS